MGINYFSISHIRLKVAIRFCSVILLVLCVELDFTYYIMPYSPAAESTYVLSDEVFVSKQVLLSFQVEWASTVSLKIALGCIVPNCHQVLLHGIVCVDPDFPLYVPQK